MLSEMMPQPTSECLPAAKISEAATVRPLIGQRSASRMAAVEIHRATSTGHACRLMRDLPGACYIAGGIDVVNRLKAGTRYGHLIALDRIPGFTAIAANRHTVVIAGGATHHALARSPVIRTTLPDVAAFIGGLGNIRIRVQGTLAGNVMAAEPAYEGLSLLLALDAALTIETTAGVTEIPARQLDPVMLSPGALITQIAIPRARTLVWDRGLRPMMGLVLGIGQTDASWGTAALNGLHRRSVGWELAPTGTPEELGREFASRLPAPDVAIDASYMRRAAAVLLRRALARASA